MDEERMEEGLEEQLKKALAEEEDQAEDTEEKKEELPETEGKEKAPEEPEKGEAPEPEEKEASSEEPEKSETPETEEKTRKEPEAEEKEAPKEEVRSAEKPAAAEEREFQPEQPEKKKKKKGKIIAAVILVLILAAAAVYMGFAYRYKDAFFNGTTINGVDCGGMTVAQVEERLKQETEEYSLTLSFRDGQTETLEGSQIGYTYVSDGSVQAIKDSQVPLMWITSLFDSTNGQATADTEYDTAMLEEALLALPELQEEQMTAPANAYVTWQDSGFVIVPETAGNQLDVQAVLNAAAEAVDQGETELDVESLDVYAKAAVTSEDPNLKTQMDQLNSLVGASVTYTLPSGQTQVLDGNTLKDWLVQNPDGSYAKDEAVWNQHIQEYVAATAAAVDTLGKDRQFQTTNRGVITRNSNLYGWQIDQEEEIAQLTQELNSGAVTSREPVYSSREVSAENNGIGYTYVEMDLSQQHLWVYENGNLWGETDIVSGKMTEQRHTPECISTIYYKETDRYLVGPEDANGNPRWNTHVDYWMPFQDNAMIGLHDASWQAAFGGDVYIYGGSQGCINLPPSFAAELYQWITGDVPIICYYSEPYSYIG